MNFSDSDKKPTIVSKIAEFLDGVEPDWEILRRPDGNYVSILFAEPSDRVYEALEKATIAVSSEDPYYSKVVINRRKEKPRDVILMPEARSLQKILSESLTVDKFTFGEAFLERYTESVTNFESSIVGSANYLVYGRRGSGKSSLLGYAMHTLRQKQLPYAWIALQAYSGRDDRNVIPFVIGEILSELQAYTDQQADFAALATRCDELSEKPGAALDAGLKAVIPRARRAIGRISASRACTIFLDDIHVLDRSLQPQLLGAIYSLTRGNNCFIKISGIEQFTNAWDSETRTGLEPPHDAQILKLDHNLTMPDRSKKHIIGILDSHAKYCGLPNIAYMAEDESLSRLVLAAAAVPRDALSLFSQAITKALIKGQKAVTVTAVNAAASEAIEEKLRDIERDIPDGSVSELRAMLDKIKEFCVKIKKSNSFLLRIGTQREEYTLVRNLIALRFVHVLHEGITPKKAGERFVALMLDLGFYIGIRAARSVKIFPQTLGVLTAKELRTLPVFSIPKQIGRKATQRK